MTNFLRNTDLDTLVRTLTRQRARRLDLTLNAHLIKSVGGNIVLDGREPLLSEEGVTDPNGTYLPTGVFHEGVAAKLGIPVKYVKRLAAERPDLYDANVNGWLHGTDGLDPDSRKLLLRLWKPTETTEPGTARALLSENFKPIENLDVLMSIIEGIQEAGINVTFDGTDLTDRRMVVRINAPEVQALAPDLLRGYRSPFTGQTGDENPTVFAGLVVSNSETANGAFSITPRLIVQVCNNGMTITKDAVRERHQGGKLPEGIIQWSDETQDKNLALIKLKARDTVTSILNVDYMRKTIADLTEKAGGKVETIDEVKDVTKRAGYTDADIEGILANFIQGGQMTRGGVMQAATAYAQTVEDADDAYDVEQRATALLTA